MITGIIGDHHHEVRAEEHIRSALMHAASATGVEVDTRWLPTSSLRDDVEHQMLEFDALWCGPSGPYANPTSARRAIRFARERQVPFLGTCAGFQYAAIEFAQNVLGFADAEHAESNPESTCAVVARLEFPLFERSAAVLLDPASRCAAIYERTEIAERYRCHYGLNPEYLSHIHRAGLRITGVDEDGIATVLESPTHPFFVGTLFMPERTSRPGASHPLVRAFLRAAVEQRPSRHLVA